MKSILKLYFLFIFLLFYRSIIYANSNSFENIHYPNSKETVPLSINNADKIVGSYTIGNENIQHGFLKDGNSYLTIDYPGAFQTILTGINDNNEIIGINDIDSFHYHQGIFTSIKFPSNGQSIITTPYDINNFGQIVGTYLEDNRIHGFLKSGESYLTIDYPGAHDTYIYGINDYGKIVGAYYSEGDNKLKGFLKDENGFTIINYPGAIETCPLKINNSNKIVGYFKDTNGNNHGFLKDGNTFLTIDYPGAIYSILTDINDNGTISGFYSDVNGLNHGFASKFIETIIIDSGFRPDKNEFGFLNFGGFFGIPILEQIIPVMGNCAGMAYASLYYYYLNIIPLNSGAPMCTNTPDYFNSQRAYIETLQLKYNNVLANIYTTLSPPSDSENYVNYNIIKSYIKMFKLPYPITIRANEGFHAVLVYKIVDKQNSKKMYIYDSNCPYCSSQDEKYIELELTQNGLKMKNYTLCGYDFYMFRPFLIPFNPIDLPQGWILHSPGYLKVTDPDGLTIDPLLNQIENAIYLFYDFDNNGTIEQAVIIGTPKQGKYTVEVLPGHDDSPDAMYSLTSFSSGTEKILAKNVPLKEAPAEGYKTLGSTTFVFQVFNKLVWPNMKKWPILGWIIPKKGYLVNEIDTHSIKLNGAIIPKVIIPFKDENRIFVLFDASDLVELVKIAEESDFKLIIQGEFRSGGIFIGQDSVRIISIKK